MDNFFIDMINKHVNNLYNKHRCKTCLLYILLVSSVEWFGPATPHWLIYYVNAIVHSPSRYLC